MSMAACHEVRAAENPAASKNPAHAAAQNPLAALENEAREKAAEVALTKVLNDNLPLTLDAKDVYPTVTTLPGGPFSPTALKLTADQLDQPLPPGDYTINTLDFCSQYSIHEPGAGLAYVLGPYEGKAAGAIGALIWRGTEQYGINPNSLQAVSWTIQSGLTYGQMPKSYQAIVDQVIPDYKSEITGDFVTNLESTYSSLAKAASLPPLDTILAKLGDPGKLALDAERQRNILTAKNTNDQIMQQTLFQGQESGIYTPVSAENGPWTERVAGQVYMKLLIAGGNMTTTNVMQIRVMPSPTANARVQVGGPHLVQASYDGAQVTPAVDNAPITLTNLMEGMLGYAVGQGAQALGQVAVSVLKALNPLGVTPAEAAEAAAPATPGPAKPAPTWSSAACAISECQTAQTANGSQPSFTFTSCSKAMTSQQLYTAYNSLYRGSPTFSCLMKGVGNGIDVLVVDGDSPKGLAYQKQASDGYTKITTDNKGSNLRIPPNADDYAFTYIQNGVIKVVISAQALLNNGYNTGTPMNPVAPESVQQTLAYELGQNAYCLSQNSKFAEQPDEERTNQIMQEVGQANGHLFVPNAATDGRPSNDKIMSGADYFDPGRSKDPKNGVLDFAQKKTLPGLADNPKTAEVYASTTGAAVSDLAEPCDVSPASK